jgi:hypothetical protein
MAKSATERWCVEAKLKLLTTSLVQAVKNARQRKSKECWLRRKYLTIKMKNIPNPKYVATTSKRSSVLFPAKKMEYVSGMPKRRNIIKKEIKLIPTKTFFDSLSAKGLAGDMEPSLYSINNA